MANEATIQSSLNIRAGNIQYQSRPSTFNANVTGRKGPTPGAVRIATTPGTSVLFGELTTPGLVRIQNLDETNFVKWGVWNGVTFYSLGKILPGESYVFRMSEDFDAGTGTSGHEFRIVADTAACVVVVDAFEA